jgi:hypothetical protein
VARAEGDVPQAEKYLRDLVAAVPDRPEYAVEWIEVMTRGAILLPHLRERALGDAATAAARLPGDGRVLAVLAAMRAAIGLPIQAIRTYEAALAAKGEPAPPGTAAALARLLLAMDVASEDEARDVGLRAVALLRGDAGTYADRDALDLLARLESRAGHEKAAAEVERDLVALDEAEGLDRHRKAWRALVEGGVDEALAASTEATDRLPGSAAAWELRGLAELVASADTPGAEDALRAVALGSLARAVAVAKDPAAERARVRAILRWFRVDPATLPEQPAG